jgi:protein-tyrosine-phosphatase
MLCSRICPKTVAKGRPAKSALRKFVKVVNEKEFQVTEAKALNVLFLCTHNSARSILAEALLNHMGKGKFKAFSAGSSPKDNQQPNPLAIATLEKAGISTQGLTSKNWDVFALPDAPHMDLVITVCDNAAGEVCPYWPGQPATAHWGYADPSEAVGGEEEKLEAFKQTMHQIGRRLDLFVSLPLASLSKMALENSARNLAKK